MPIILYSVGIFLSAVLLFSIQPMAAKALLPVFGGTPGVWTVCMLFFQAILLLAYGYAVLLSWCPRQRLWRIVHTTVLLVSLLTLPWVFQAHNTSSVPEWSILRSLMTQLGLALLVVGASAPLIQFLFSQTATIRARDPYFLYIASNAGSLIALMSYPWFIERYLGLNLQFKFWCWGYVAYVLLIIYLMFVPKFNFSSHTQQEHEYSWRQLGYWVLLSFIPCSLMLGVTLYITTDVAAAPLFWVLPLALYLLTFILAFSESKVVPYAWFQRNSFFFLIFTLLGFILNGGQIRAWQIILVNLFSFFTFALLCHRQLYLRRPPPQRLTVFYFCLSLGGFLAGMFNGIVAPHLFNQVYEYPLALLLVTIVLFTSGAIKKQSKLALLCKFSVIVMLLCAQYVLPEIHWPANLTNFQFSAVLCLILIVLWQDNLWAATGSLALLLAFIFIPQLQQDNILVQQRNFYGMKKVVAREDVHALISQSTVHGLQLMSEDTPNGFRSYYGAIEAVATEFKQELERLQVTVLGLGIGTIACQFRTQDQLNLVEIDQQVINLAQNKKYFTYLDKCAPQLNIILGDGRLALHRIPDASQNLLFVDAFNSDAIPMHLITLEAFNLYQQKLAPNGGILVNLSNRHLRILPLITAIGRETGMMVFHTLAPGNPALGQFPAEWALLTKNEQLAHVLLRKNSWRFVADQEQILWTDNYSNIIPLLKW